MDDNGIRRRVAERASERTPKGQSPALRASRSKPDIPEQEPGFVWTRASMQCRTARRGDGYRCQVAAIPGGSVCRFHGGKNPRVQSKARLRLLETVDSAIAVLAREMVQADKSADRQRAANSLLDRAGVPRMSVVEGTDALDGFAQKLREVMPEVYEMPPENTNQNNEDEGNEA